MTRAYGARLRALPEPTRDAVGLLALAGSAPTSTVWAAMAELGLKEGDLAEAEDLEVLRIEDGVVQFVHPLLRAAALDQLSAGRRRTLHRVLADAAPADVERAGAHLAAAATGPDEETARALDAAAAAARRRGGLALAAPVLGRAAALTAPGDLRCDRLLAAAWASALAGHPGEAQRLSHDVLRSTTDPFRRADAAAVLGRMAVWGTDVADALATARDAAAQMTGVDRVRAVRALSQAFIAAMAGAAGLNTALRLAEEAVALLDQDMPPAVRDDVHHLHAMGLLAVGRGREAARYFDSWTCPSSAEISADDLAEYRLTGIAQLLYRLGRLADAEELANALLHACGARPHRRRRRWSPGSPPSCGGGRGAGPMPWRPATRRRRLAEQTGQLALGLVRPRGAGPRPREPRDRSLCREHARWSDTSAREHGLTPVLAYTSQALGLLELGLGNPMVTAEHLTEATWSARRASWASPTMVPWAPTSWKPCTGPAATPARPPSRSARSSPTGPVPRGRSPRWPAAAVCWPRTGRTPTSTSASALVLAPADVPFELARTRLCWGERLRRRRTWTRRARSCGKPSPPSTSLGARSSAQRRPRRDRARRGATSYDPPTALSALTAQELRCGLAVADGLSNREVAAALFVSQKTVEYHLNKAYTSSASAPAPSSPASSRTTRGDGRRRSRAGSFVRPSGGGVRGARVHADQYGRSSSETGASRVNNGTPMTYVIVGAGLAGARAAEALREGGYEGPVVLLGAEQHRPTSAPRSRRSTSRARPNATRSSWHSADWYREHDVDLRVVPPSPRSTATPRRSSSTTTPARATTRCCWPPGRRRAICGCRAPSSRRVHYLRYLEDSDRLKTVLQEAGHVAVIGAGWIGLEVAAAARTAGVDVAVLEAADAPLLGVLGPEIAEVFAGLHREHGVDLRVGVQVTEIVGKDGAWRVSVWATGPSSTPTRWSSGSARPRTPSSPRARAWRSTTASGSMRTCAAATPRLRGRGHREHPPPGPRPGAMRVEHWATAAVQRPGGTRAENARAGPAAILLHRPYDLGWSTPPRRARRPRPGIEVVVRGDLAAEFIAFWLRDGRLLAGMNVNIWTTSPTTSSGSSGPVHALDPARLADPEVPLSDL